MPPIPAATPPAADTSDLGTVARLGAQRSKWKAAAKKLVAERDADKKKVEELQKQIDDLKKAGGPEEVAKLKQTIRETSHRAKFDELAKAAGAKDKALNDLWEKSGYKAEGDAPDEAKIKTAIEAQRAERDYAFNAQGDGQQQEQLHGFDPFATEPARPGPGRGQGGAAQNQAGVFGISQQQLRDPAWCFANQAAIAKASKEAANLPLSQVANKLAIL
jgi:hypothetical protein